MIHDYKHPGTTNAFQQSTASSLALRYNDQSVLEHMHLSETFLLLNNPTYNIFANSNLSPLQKKELRETIITMVLATDMKHHFSGITEWQAYVEVQRQKSSPHSYEATRNERLLLLKNVLHCADISNPTKPTDIYVEWANRIMREWWEQGDQEKALGLEVNTFC